MGDLSFLFCFYNIKKKLGRKWSKRELKKYKIFVYRNKLFIFAKKYLIYNIIITLFL